MTTAVSNRPIRTDLAEVRERADELRSLMDAEWRYTRARQLCEERVVRHCRSEDPWVAGLTHFLRRHRNATPADMEHINAKYPDFLWAHTIYTQEDRGPRFHVEALVVAGMSTEEIADYLDLPYQVVDTYEHCYFDLRPHLTKRGAVRAYLHAKLGSRGLRDMDPDPYWKLIALDEGVPMLMSMWGYGALDENEKRQLDLSIAAQARRNAMMATHARGIRPDNAGEVVKEYSELVHTEIERLRLEADGGFGGDPIREILGGLFHAIQLTVAPVQKGSEKAYLEMSNVVNSAPALLDRLQGAAPEEKKADDELPKDS